VTGVTTEQYLSKHWLVSLLSSICPNTDWCHCWAVLVPTVTWDIPCAETGDKETGWLASSILGFLIFTLTACMLLACENCVCVCVCTCVWCVCVFVCACACACMHMRMAIFNAVRCVLSWHMMLRQINVYSFCGGDTTSHCNTVYISLLLLL